jgi:opacity protein-like surface antigen
VDVAVLGWEKVQNDPFLEDVTIRSESYRSMTLAVGAYGKWEVTNNFSLNGKLLGGVMWMQSPYQLYKPTYFLVEPKWYEITSARDRNAAFIAGAGVQYDVSNCIGLKVDADYNYSKMVFSFNTAQGLRNEYRDIHFVNLSFGVVINL